MSDQKVPNDLTFVSLLFLVLFGGLIIFTSPSVEVAVKNLLISLPISLFGVALYAICDKIFDGVKFKIPKSLPRSLTTFLLVHAMTLRARVRLRSSRSGKGGELTPQVQHT